MNLDKIIATLQSTIARRGVELADLESIYSIRKATAYTKPQYRLVRAIRDQIKPLAKAQKFDRIVLHELTDKRTEENKYTKYMTTLPPMFIIEEISQVGNLTQSNKYSFF